MRGYKVVFHSYAKQSRSAVDMPVLQPYNDDVRKNSPTQTALPTHLHIAKILARMFRLTKHVFPY